MSTLSYQSATTRPTIRFWRLAAGSALIAAAAALLLLAMLFFARPIMGHSLPTWWRIANELPGLAAGLMLLTAIILLDIALPRAGTRRMPFIACLTLATIHVLIGIFFLLSAAFPQPLTYTHYQTILVLETLSLFLQLALLIAAIRYLLRLGQALDKKPLGILAALALIPCVLCLLYILLYLSLTHLATLFPELAHWPYLLEDWSGLILHKVSALIQYFILFLTWSAVALTAAILALKSRPRA